MAPQPDGGGDGDESRGQQDPQPGLLRRRQDCCSAPRGGPGSRSPRPSLADSDPETHLGVGGTGVGEEREPPESVTKETPLAGAATRASNPENF